LNIRLSIMLMLLALLSCKGLMAREIVFGDEVEKINLSYGEETILRFPSQVKTISNVSDFEVSPVDKTDPDYSLLSIKPIFRKAKGKVLFVLEDGTVLRTQFRTMKKASSLNSDSFYEFVSKKHIVNREDKLASISELELMKAMIRDDTVTGYKKRKLVRTLWGIGKSIKVQLIRSYKGKRFNGHVFRVENKSSKKTIKLNVESITLGKPNQSIMSQIDDEVIYPKKIGKAVTYLRIVAKPGSIYTDIGLPYEMKKGGKRD